MIKNFCISAMLIFITLFGQSCTSIMDPDAAELKTSLKQLNPRANIRPASEKDMLVYVRYRNSSGSVLDVKDSVMNEITQSGYRIVNDMDQAQYVMIADLRFVGQKSSDTYGHTVFGALLGAVAGAVIGHQIGCGTTEKVVGGGIGAVLGGLAGKAIDNRNRIVTVDMVVDIRIGERIKGGVTTNRAGDSNRGITQNTRSSTSGGSFESGRSGSNYSESTKFEQKEDFFYHENRFIATATKLKLTYGEAHTALSGQISRAIAGSLP